MRRFALAAVATFVVATPLFAQQGGLRAAPSTRATTVVSLSPPRVQGAPAPTAVTITIDYGQPHARGRSVPAELANSGTVWRTGANVSTTLTTEVDLTIGGRDVPKGSYSIFTIRDGDNYQLIVNQNTGQWGTEYDQSKDLVRIPLRSRALHEAQESLSITLVPAAEPPARGVLAISWGQLHLSADWSVK